jgi:hypothetical protein
VFRFFGLSKADTNNVYLEKIYIMEEVKYCSCCKETKSYSEFAKWKNAASHKPQLQSWCKVCIRAYGKEKTNKERIRANIRLKRQNPAYVKREAQVNKLSRETNKEVYLVKSARERAKVEGMEFNITKDDISVPTHCPILGIEMKTYTPYAPSIDKIDPTKGYVKNNVWVISRKANMMKNNATKEELIAFSKFWLNNPICWTK